MLNINNKKITKILLGSITLKYLLYQQNYVKLEEQEERNLQLKKFQEEAYDYYIDLKEPLELYKIYSYNIQTVDNQNRNFIIIRLSQNAVIAFLNECPQDKKSSLKDGFLMRNKIICPYHGCEYNIENGQVERYPSFRNLVVYPVELNEQKQQFKITLPKKLPLFQNQNFVQYNPEDHRKVIIIGSGPSGISAATSLRQFEYTGNIFVFTKDTTPPIQKQNLTKSIDFKDNKNDLEYYSKSILDQLNINILYGTEIQKIDNDSSAISYVQHDDSKYMYDILIIATGSEKPQAFQSDNIAQNFIYLNNKYDLQKSSKQIKDSQKILIMGISEESLELASTIKQYDDKKQIQILDIGVNRIKKMYQDKLYEDLLNKFQSQGIQIIKDKKLKNIKFKKQNNIIESVRFGKKDNQYHPVDLVYKFKIGEQGQKMWTKENEFFIYTYSQYKINVDISLKTFHDNIFSIGQGARILDPITDIKVEQTTWSDAQEQGRLAALNALGQRYEYRNISFGYYDYFGKSFQKVGQLTIADQDYQIGEVNDLDFIKIYAKDNIIIGCVSAGLKFNKIGLIIRESLKQRNKLFLSDLKQDHNTFIKNLYLKLLQNPLSGTHYENFYRRIHNPDKRYIQFKSKNYYELQDLDSYNETDDLKDKFDKRLS